MKIVVVSAEKFSETHNKIQPSGRICALDLPTANLLFLGQNVLMVVDSEVSIEGIDPDQPISMMALAAPSGSGIFKTIKERTNG